MAAKLRALGVTLPKVFCPEVGSHAPRTTRARGFGQGFQPSSRHFVTSRNTIAASADVWWKATNTENSSSLFCSDAVQTASISGELRFVSLSLSSYC